MEASDVKAWVDGYRKAWESNDPEDIGRLFTDDALYYTEPFHDPWRGRDAIVQGWIKQKDEPGDTEFSYEVLATAGDLAFVKGETAYSTPPPRRYSNLWVLRLDEQGRASEFTEWWMKQE